jgi:hypothetical protein
VLKHLIWFGLSPAPVITEHSLRCGVLSSNVKSAAYSARRVSGVPSAPEVAGTFGERGLLTHSRPQGRIGSLAGQRDDLARTML